ncbi:Uncharacterised protein [Escherichia coli]|nr:Uncharacterised protein [Escherichia coli]
MYIWRNLLNVIINLRVRILSNGLQTKDEIHVHCSRVQNLNQAIHFVLVAMPDELNQKVEMREQSVEYHGHNEQKARH